MDYDKENTELRKLLTLLRSYDAPGPACATALYQAGENDWNPRTTPWLNDDEQQRKDAFNAIRRAYQQASQGRDTHGASKLAGTVASRMTAGSGTYMSRRYLEAAEKPARHQESFNQIMTLASEMHTEEATHTMELITLGLAEKERSRMDFGIKMLLRRITQAEAAAHTGGVIYTDSTEPGLAARIEAATWERGMLLASDMEAEIRRRLPGHLGNRPGLKLWDLYGHPAAIAVYTESRDELELEADRPLTDRAIATMPWPAPTGRNAWNPRQILEELLRLHQRSVERGRQWDGTIDFSI